METGATWKAWVTIAVILLVLATLALSRFRPHVVLVGALTLLLSLGIIDQKGVLAGLSNPGMATVGVLFAVVAGMRDTGALSWIAQQLLGQPKSPASARMRIVGPVALSSAFMNNIPLVAMMLPVITEWSKKIRVSTSQLLIPLSYASILGGTCTLIGTSTVLVVDGLITTELGADYSLGMFEITAVGLPCALAGSLYILMFSRWLLVDRRPAISVRDDPREYTIEMIVDRTSPLVGRTIETAGLRQLPGAYLMEVQRGEHIMPAVAPDTALEEGDRLVFAGIVGSVVDLQKTRGLLPATDQVFKLDVPRASRTLVEVVVSHTCPLVGQTIREGRFRSRYSAAVIAVARSGERLKKKVGDIQLQPGDTLLLEAPQSFVDQHKDSRDFYLVSQIADSNPPRHERAPIAIAILTAMVVVVALGWLSMLNAALLAAGLMVITRCCTSASALRSIEWQVLLVIVAAFGLGHAMEQSGAASLVADTLLRMYGTSPTSTLAALTGLTMVFTNVMNANAAAVLVFPVGVEAAHHLSVNPMPFAIGIIMGAACSFATPIGYQTNLMVYGPGGYRFVDFVRFGGPLSLIIWALSVAIIPNVWRF